MALDKLQETIVSLFARRVHEDGARTALHVKRQGRFQPVTWNELAGDVHRTAAALARLGLHKGDRLALVSENRYEWIVIDLAVHWLGGVHVAMHASLSGEQLAYQLRDSGARLAILSSCDQAQKLAALDREQLPRDIDFFTLDACDATIAGRPCGWLQSAIAEVTAAEHAEIEQADPGRVQPGDLATILYTSGTTGEPKGVMLSHGNLAFNAIASLKAFGLADGELRLCWLPLSHIFARTADLYSWLGSRSEMALAESRDTLLADCAQVRPTFINGVPYFYDKIYRYLHDQRRQDEPEAVRQLLGGRVRSCCAGGAALSDRVAEFFARQGIPLVEGYGMTESSPVITAGSPADYRIGTVGRPIPGVEVAIANDGEVLTRGPHVMQGYWNKPDATRDAVRDGWLHTGDLGAIDDGYLRITGRKKELIVTAAGKNIAPVYLEQLLADDPLVAQVMVIGDGRNYLTALVVPELRQLQEEMRCAGVSWTDDWSENPDVERFITGRIAARLKNVSHCEQVQKVALLREPFSVERGELTPTLKLRRSVIAQRYHDRIEAMYAV